VYDARKREIGFHLTEEEFAKIIASPNCRYCGVPKSLVPLGVDRVDSKGDYTLENTTPCCSACNYMKRVEGVDEFIARMVRITEIHQDHQGLMEKDTTK
jgi:hypothetical protein